jgi:hypothetical protein
MSYAVHSAAAHHVLNLCPSSLPLVPAAAQRGSGVFERSIQALKLLNAQGYGRPGTGLVLDLVYNPGGPFLAPEQVEGAGND